MLPHFGTNGAQKGVEGPTTRDDTPEAEWYRAALIAPNPIAGQHHQRIDPEGPLNSSDGGVLIPTLFFAQAQAALHLAVGDL